MGVDASALRLVVDMTRDEVLYDPLGLRPTIGSMADPGADIVIVRHGTGPGEIDWVPFLGDIADFTVEHAPGS